MSECACELGCSALPFAFGFRDKNNMWTNALCTMTVDTYTKAHSLFSSWSCLIHVEFCGDLRANDMMLNFLCRSIHLFKKKNVFSTMTWIHHFYDEHNDKHYSCFEARKVKKQKQSVNKRKKMTVLRSVSPKKQIIRQSFYILLFRCVQKYLRCKENILLLFSLWLYHMTFLIIFIYNYLSIAIPEPLYKYTSNSLSLI